MLASVGGDNGPSPTNHARMWLHVCYNHPSFLIEAVVAHAVAPKKLVNAHTFVTPEITGMANLLALSYTRCGIL